MQLADFTAHLRAAPEEHQRRSALTASAIEGGRWGAAACYSRQAAAAAHEWANVAFQLATFCDAQAEVAHFGTSVPPSLEELAESGTLVQKCGAPTLESLEAGLLALAHHLGRDHAVHTRRAMVNVLLAKPAAPASVEG